jgi:hypothetical protein
VSLGPVPPFLGESHQPVGPPQAWGVERNTRMATHPKIRSPRGAARRTMDHGSLHGWHRQISDPPRRSVRGKRHQSMGGSRQVSAEAEEDDLDDGAVKRSLTTPSALSQLSASGGSLARRRSTTGAAGLSTSTPRTSSKIVVPGSIHDSGTVLVSRCTGCETVFEPGSLAKHCANCGEEP